MAESDDSRQRDQLASDLAIGQERPLWHWTWRFIGALLLTLGLVWGATEWLDVNDKQAHQELAPLHIMEFMIAVLLASVYTTWRAVLYYRRRYRLHRNRGLVKDLYTDRTWLQDHYLERLGKAEKQFTISGISLHTFITTPGLSLAVQRALTEHEQLQVRLLLMHPFSPLVWQREREEERPRGRISSDCLRNIEAALSIKACLGSSHADRFSVRVVDGYAPIGFFMAVDNELFFEPYLDKFPGRTCTTFRLERNGANEKAWDRLYDHMEFLLGRSKEAESIFTDSIGYLTEYGRARHRAGLQRAVFLDRDGVLITDTGYVGSPAKVELMPASAAFVARAARSFRIIVVSNQSGVARGLFTIEDAEMTNQRVLELLAAEGAQVDALYYCPHHPTEGVSLWTRECPCRKEV